MSGRVAGKVIVVTGAGQGQGAAEARLLAAEGATVLALGLGTHRSRTSPASGYQRLDVTDAVGWRVLAEGVGTRFGRVDGLVANAGITWRARVAELDPADLARVSEVNVTGPERSTRSPRWSCSCSATTPRSSPAPRSPSTAG